MRHRVSRLTRPELEPRKLAGQLKDKKPELAGIEKGQTRLRDALKGLGETPDEAILRKRYVTKLAAQEEKLERLRAEIASAKQEKEALTKQLGAAADALSLSLKPG